MAEPIIAQRKNLMIALKWAWFLLVYKNKGF